MVLTGCSGSVKEGSSIQEELSVERLKDGREGFVIKEISSMDAESLEDFERAVALMEDHNYDKAIELFDKVIERSPGITAPYINIAMAYGQIDKLEPAEEHLKTALDLVPDHPVVGNEYGLLLRKSGRFTEARDIYEKTLKSFPEYLPAHRNLGILCDLYLNDQECALKHYEIYSEAMPEEEQVKMWIADLRMRLGR
ncbi:MAG: tetratricopeptide repeat protein [Thermodesulfobacteriota bacterium]